MHRKIVYSAVLLAMATIELNFQGRCISISLLFEISFSSFLLHEMFYTLPFTSYLECNMVCDLFKD